MTNVSVQFKGAKQFQKALKSTETQVNRKAQQALNRTLTRSRTQMTNAIGEKLNLKKKTIRDMISLQKANKNTGLIGRLVVKNKLIPLIEYKAKQNRKGVSFKLYRSRPRQLIRHSFIMLDKRGRDTVFKREGRARLKIKPLYGTIIHDVAVKQRHQTFIFANSFFKNEVLRLFTSTSK